MTENEQAMVDFCSQFSPPLKYVKTDKINNIAFSDAWQTSYWDGTRSIGITTVIYNGGIHAFIEAAGPSDIAKATGRVLASALGMFRGGS